MITTTSVTTQAKAPTKAEVMLHPVGIRILGALHNRQMTPREIGGLLPDIPQATLYRHIRRLHDVGLLEVVAERQAHGAVERAYAIIEAGSVLTEEEAAALTPKEFARHFRAFVGMLLRTQERYTTREEIDLNRDGVVMFFKTAYLSDKEMESLGTELEQRLVAAAKNEPAPGRHRRQLTVFALPDDIERGDEGKITETE